MKKLITLLLLIASSNLFAQTDSFEVKETKLVKAYNYFTMARKEETKIWKVNVFPNIVGSAVWLHQRYDYLITSLSFENKIRPTISYNIEGLLNLSSNNISTNNSISHTTLCNLSLSVEFKYYYGLKNRMHKHHSANNFSASYFSLKTSRLIYYTFTSEFQKNSYVNEDETPSESNIPILTEQQRGTFNNNYFSIYHGFQRRFLKIGYFDIQTGLTYKYSKTYLSSPYDYTTQPFTSSNKLSRILPFLNIKLGFAF